MILTRLMSSGARGALKVVAENCGFDTRTAGLKDIEKCFAGNRIHKRYFARVLGSVLMLLCCSCSSLGFGYFFGQDDSGPDSPAKQVPSAPEPVSAVSEDAPESQWLGDAERHPLKVRVAQAFFNGEDLHIKVHVSTKTELPADSIVVEVSGLREGEIKESQYQQLSKVTGLPLLQAGQIIVVPFTLQAQELTEYQVRTTWGEEAQAVLRAHASNEDASQSVKHAQNLPAEIELQTTPPNLLARAAGPELRLENLAVSEEELVCDDAPCDLLYTLEAELVNHGEMAAHAPSLALGLYWANEGQVPQIPLSDQGLMPQEEHIFLDTLVLEPGARRPLRVRVDRAVPQVPGGRFIPHLRVLPQAKNQAESLGENDLENE